MNEQPQTTEDKLSPRVAFAKSIENLAEANQDINVVTSDTSGSTKTTSFAEKFPDQFIEVGIAEQNAVGIGAGLAIAGKVPFVCGHACFYSARVVEQIKNDLAYSNLNVTIIGVSGGLSYSQLGATHHSLHDVALFRAIPNIQILLPADFYQVKEMIKALVEYEGPAYLRMGRNPRPTVYSESHHPFELGKGNTLLEGDDITLISTGKMVYNAFQAGKILAEEGIKVKVIDLPTLRPLDEELILEAAEETGSILTVEEHRVHGGLGGAVAEVVTKKHPVPIKTLGIPDEFSIGGPTEDVFNHYGLDPEGIARSAKKHLTE